MRVLFPKGSDFEAAAYDLFDSLDQVDAAARALLRAGMLERTDDGRLAAVRDLSDADVAFAVSADRARIEGED